jgi:hypothetical protein
MLSAHLLSTCEVHVLLVVAYSVAGMLQHHPNSNRIKDGD